MKQYRYLLVNLAAIALIGCTTSTAIDGSSVASSEETSSASSSSIVTSSGAASSASVDYSTLKAQYGDFSIVKEDGNANYTYDEANHVYTLSVASAAKATFTLKGYFDGQIRIANPSAIAEGSYKGVCIKLVGACLVNAENNSGPVIYYGLESKNIEIKAKDGTYNKVIANNESAAVYSLNNIEIDGSGTLDIYSFGIDAHGVETEGDLSIYGGVKLQVYYAAHDAFHGKHLYFDNDKGAGTPYSGTLTVSQALSQAFDFETSKGKGSVSVLGGDFIIANCASVFKTDASLDIAESVSIEATNLSEDPVIAGENSSGLAYTCAGTFNVDGVAYTYNN